MGNTEQVDLTISSFTGDHDLVPKIRLINMREIENKRSHTIRCKIILDTAKVVLVLMVKEK